MIGQAQRRLVGVALVALTVLAVTAIGVATRPVAGTPTAAPIPPAPLVGDCVLTRPTGIGWDDQPGAGPDDPPAAAETGPATDPGTVRSPPWTRPRPRSMSSWGNGPNAISR